ncbi:CheB methylesterase domain-containing protein [Nitrosophilus alvini]|uniref:CheB methylesterase domain-containing protein n=1 Tax=Nitrosophilus alvini TaxID=2714855 RepID=UPI00190C906E|nr:CheB methylesterase domain-containing protein [Nitrosophilus alvini]
MKIAVIGVSTGGPSQIERIVKEIKEARRGVIVICLHMQPEILKSFVKRLSNISQMPVYESAEALRLEKNSIIVCTADKDTLLKRDREKKILKLDKDSSSFYKPDINKFFLSVAENFTDYKNIMAILLTGIGEDGVEGLKVLKDRGAKTYAADEKSCIVYGMPKRAHEENACSEVLTLDEIIEKMKRFLNE